MRKALFHVQINTHRGLRLQARLQDAGIEAFEYHSARSAEDVVQVGVISCCVFTGTPFDQVEVQLEANRHAVTFRCLDDNTVHHVQRQQFAVNGELPRPMHWWAP
jgi:hypothetical protein